jgi:uncharacterized protein YdhG (YjbR/CyaY superfamily)
MHKYASIGAGADEVPAPIVLINQERCTMKNGAVPATIDEYLSGLPADVRTALEELRQTIRAAAPEAVEGISYQIPTFRWHGALVHFAAFKDHCSFFPGSKVTAQQFRAELEGYAMSAGATIHFTVAHPLPAELVTRMVAARIVENAAREKARATRKIR